MSPTAPAVTAPPLRRPVSLLIYLATIPGFTVFMLASRQWLAAIVGALLVLEVGLAIYATDTSTAEALADDIRTRYERATADAAAAVPLDAIRASAVIAAAPGIVGGAGYLYVLRFSTGIVKVGQTTNPASRLRTHHSEAKAYGAPIVDVWLSPPHGRYLRNETALIRYCASRAPRLRSEYFHGLDFEDAVARATQLAETGR